MFKNIHFCENSGCFKAASTWRLHWSGQAQVGHSGGEKATPRGAHNLNTPYFWQRKQSPDS